MGRLVGRGLPSRLSRPKPRLRAAEVSPRDALETERRAPWRKWYSLARWRLLRWSVLEAALFTCVRCERIEADTSRLVADHKVPHRGDPALFWDPTNLQCLCKACHDGAKQREEALL